MSERFSLEIFVAVPWGTGTDAIPEVLQDHPAFGEMTPEQMRKVRAPVRIRLDAEGGLHALADAPTATPGGVALIYHFDARGKLLGRTPVSHVIPQTQPARIVDYAVAADGTCYLLEYIEPQNSSPAQNRLRKLNPAGEVQWSRTGLNSHEHLDLQVLEGEFTRILLDRHSRLYLSASDSSGSIAEIDVATGGTASVHASGVGSSEVFMDAQGIAYSIAYFPEKRRRGLAVFDPRSGRLQTTAFSSDAYGWLTYPLGVDASSNTYAWKDSSIARISLEGSIEVLAELNGAAIRSDGAVISSRLVQCENHSLAVELEQRSPLPLGNDRAGRRVLFLPEKLGAQLAGEWKLIHVDHRGRYYVFGGEAPGTPGTLLMYSNDGTFEETASPPPDLLPFESRIENHRQWTVDALGRIYIPIIDSYGFKVLRLQAQQAATPSPPAKQD